MAMAKIPEFDSVEEEREFWDTHDFADYVDDTEPVPDPILVERVSTRNADDILTPGERRALDEIAKRTGEAPAAVAHKGLRAYLLKQCRELGIDFFELVTADEPE